MGKILLVFLRPRGARNGPKMRFFEFCQKPMHENVLVFFAWSYRSKKTNRHLTNFFGNLSDFCMKLNDFLGKILLWGLGEKGDKNELSKIHNKSMDWIFLIFSISYNMTKNKINKIIFENRCFADVALKRSPKWTRNGVFKVLW